MPLRLNTALMCASYIPIYVHEAQREENENKVATALRLRMVRPGFYRLKYRE